jgi:hypothetical protein
VVEPAPIYRGIRKELRGRDYLLSSCNSAVRKADELLRLESRPRDLRFGVGVTAARGVSPI